MSPEEQREHDERQAELVRQLESGLPSPKYVPKPEDFSTEFSSSDIRIYTSAKLGAKAKFWGVIERGETFEEFWARRDPENTRLEEEAESHGAHEIEKALEATPSREKSSAKRRRRGSTTSINSNHRVKKPTASTSPVNRNTPRSLGSAKGMKHQGEANQAQPDEAKGSSSRSTRSRGVARALGRQQMTVGRTYSPTKKVRTPKLAKKRKAAARTRQVALKDTVPESAEDTTQAVNDTLSLKRRVDQAPTEVKPTARKKARKKERTLVVQGNVKVIKKKQLTKPSAAPSVHGMRTRARGSAEKTQAAGHRSFD